MIISSTGRLPDSATSEKFHDIGAETPWLGGESSTQHSVVRGKRILLVEDDEHLRASLRMMLEFDGHQVTEAGNGAEALNLFTPGELDLVITDFQMPVMEGNELAASIKLVAPSLPILMITASERAGGDADNPVDALLNKPVKMSGLRCAIRELLSAQPAPVRGEWVSSDTRSLVCQ